jgi:hypothetical protein
VSETETLIQFRAKIYNQEQVTQAVSLSIQNKPMTLLFQVLEALNQTSNKQIYQIMFINMENLCLS